MELRHGRLMTYSWTGTDGRNNVATSDATISSKGISPLYSRPPPPPPPPHPTPPVLISDDCREIIDINPSNLLTEPMAAVIGLATGTSSIFDWLSAD